MKKIFFIILILFFLNLNVVNSVYAVDLPERVKGRILLQVEENGEAWYVNPDNFKRYYLGLPSDAFRIMRELSLGITNQDFDAFNGLAASRLAGKILLKVEDLGKAFYVNPLDLRMYYLGRPNDAFRIMRQQGLGITNNDLAKIEEYSEESEEIKLPQNILLDVPFTSQAPFGDWSNPMLQDGCEEAAILMAWHWLNHQPLTKAEAEQEIIAISQYELETYGEFRDRSIRDTAQLMREYYNYDNLEVENNIDSDDIINQLKQGNLVIVPANGQKLNNPYYTAPGPVNHMLVIIGYDEATQEFITNDPGTRHGATFRFSKVNLEASIRDYPTGHHEANPEINKVMLVVKLK